MTEVRYSGPIFDGRAAVAGSQYCEAIKREVADQGVQLVRANLTASIKKNEGDYVSEIQVNRAQKDFRVWDGRSVYGPWLEGQGSRNKTTRFKGYFPFRRATQQLNGQVKRIALLAFGPFRSRMQ